MNKNTEIELSKVAVTMIEFLFIQKKVLDVYSTYTEAVLLMTTNNYQKYFIYIPIELNETNKVELKAFINGLIIGMRK